MDNFIVSARKYRPQHFNTVVGQGHITATLKNAIATGQLAQAYLFCGPRGVGKTTCARIFAKTINCTSLTADGESCDQCESCRSFNSGASLNVYELDAASNNSVDDIRNLVDQVRFAPQLGDYKVYIIDEVHMLSASAFNAFLKTLEEPPKHAKFILATTEKHKILPTILSRCQVFNFNRIKPEDIGNHLAFMAKNESVQAEPEALHIIAQKADGGLRDACSIFDQMVAFTGGNLTYRQVVENLHVLDYEYYFALVDAFLAGDIPKVMLAFNEILSKGFDGHNFLLGLGEHLRNLLVGKDQQTISLLEVSAALKGRYAAQAAACDQNFLLRALGEISKADVSYKSARNQRLLVEMTLMRLCFAGSADPEKKNDEVESTSRPQPRQVDRPPVMSQAPEPVKLATRPTVPFDQLKFKTAFSLQEAGGRQPSTTVTATAEVVEEKPLRLLNKPYELRDVEECIGRFAEHKLQSGARQAGTIFKTASVALSEGTVLLTIQNEAQKEVLMEMRQEFVDMLRLDLGNAQVGLEIRIAAAETQSKAFKPHDIFRAMSERNPVLMELKKRFDLEIDY